MKAPISWLREYVDLAIEAEQLGQDLTKLGLELGGVAAHGADVVLDFEVTTNRVDCMNVLGLAREASVRYGQPLRLPAADVVEVGAPAADVLTVGIDASDLCPFFAARVLEVRIGPSPDWLAARLEAVGVRSINNVVDLTNYVMLETGQPSHAFDLERLPAAGLRARWAKAGERLTTLDGVDRELTPRNGLVAAADGTALALAGVMGGGSSEVHDGTRLVALEAAYWNPLATRRSAKAQGLHTEASHRFERGADPAATLLALDRIAHLVVKLGIGSVRPGILSAGAMPAARHVSYRPARTNRIVGVVVPEAEQRRVLAGLGFAVAGGDSGAWDVTVPTWRGDVAAEIDVVEEIARHHGIDNVPATIPPAARPGRLRDEARAARRVRELLSGAGLSEAISLSMLADATQRDVAPARVRLANPLSEEGDALRASVAFPGLVLALQHNQRQGRREVRLFELGSAYLPVADPAARPREVRRVAVLLSGPDPQAHWSGRRGAADFAELKGVVEGLVDGLGVAPLAWEPGTPSFLHPGQSARLRRGQVEVGWAGGLHPDVAVGYDLRDPVFLAELDLASLLAARAAVRFAALPRFPSVSRDLSVLCPPGLSAAAVESIIRQVAGTSLRHVAFVDRYAGPQVPAGHVSLTLSLRFSEPDRTMVGEEVQRAVEAAVQALTAAGAEIRGVS
ncbi:MAG: phenylalanine--tRNA ligase subunit beta [Vicinamibacteria bacterium]|nr:phenylalanine--tRNA ligase subunit beta [Vicinamibacteria bacterium]